MKENGSSTTGSQKTDRVEDKKSSTNNVKASHKKSGTNKLLSSDSDAQGKETKEVTIALPTEPAASKANQPTDIVDDFKDIQELQSTSIEKTEGNAISQRNTSVERSSDGNMLTEDKLVQLGHVQGDEEFIKASTVVSEDKRAAEDFAEDIPEMTVHPLPPLPNKTVKFSTVNIEGNGAMNEKYLSPRISEIEISTPPPTDGMDTEPVHSRKKWNNDEDSPKEAKGFRKLLFFGRKSKNSPTY